MCGCFHVGQLNVLVNDVRPAFWRWPEPNCRNSNDPRAIGRIRAELIRPEIGVQPDTLQALKRSLHKGVIGR